MRDQKRFMPINLQFFAEPVNDPQDQTPQDQLTDDQSKDDKPSVNYDEIFGKLDAILDRRSEGIAKSALKDNGIDENEVKEIIAQYKANKANKAQQAREDLENLRRENETLKQTIINTKIETVAHAKALELGVDTNSLAYVTKLADFDKVVNDKGEVNAEAIVEAIAKVLEDVPALKGTAQQAGGFVQIGGKGSTPNDNDAQENALRRAFGLK